jgi:proteic killer suppression protein
MIASFRHKGLRHFYETGNLKGIQPHQAARLQYLLTALDAAESITDMDEPGLRLHLLKGSKDRRWSLHVNGNWRLTFEFVNGSAYIIDYEDYH